MHREAKQLIGQGLIDLTLILAVLRQSDVNILPRFQNDGVLQHEAFYDEGPLLGMISAPAHHFQYQTSRGEPGMSRKYIENQYGAIADEYEMIMRNTRLQPPAVFTIPPENSEMERIYQSTANRSVITMILSLPNEGPPWQQNGGGVQVVRNPNTQSEGAVGGIGSVNDNFDLFNNFIPENMRDDDIDSLILSGNEDLSNLSSNRGFLDVNWQHFVTDYDAFDNFRGPLKTMNASFESWGNSDILRGAVQNAELFLPVATSSQNSTEMNPLASTSSSEPSLNPCPVSSDAADLLASSRLEMIEYSGWASQNHEDDILFPLLSPASCDEILAPGQVNLTTENIASNVQQQPINHMHDHNYYNSSLTPPSDSVTSGYSIRSRREVSTRVITVPPRPRLESVGSDSGVSSGASDTIDLTSDLNHDVIRSSVRRITISEGSIEDVREAETVGGYSLNSKPVDSRYFDSLAKDIGLRREVILCS